MNVFLSYPGILHHSNIISEIKNTISQEGCSLIDIDTLSKKFTNFFEKVVNSIQSCDLFIAVVTNEYFNSQDCRRELDYAIQKGKKIVFILPRWEEMMTNIFLRPYRDSYHMISWDREGETQLSDLLRHLKERLEESSENKVSSNDSNSDNEFEVHRNRVQLPNYNLKACSDDGYDFDNPRPSKDIVLNAAHIGDSNPVKKRILIVLAIAAIAIFLWMFWTRQSSPRDMEPSTPSENYGDKVHSPSEEITSPIPSDIPEATESPSGNFEDEPICETPNFEPNQKPTEDEPSITEPIEETKPTPIENGPVTNPIENDPVTNPIENVEEYPSSSTPTEHEPYQPSHQGYPYLWIIGALVVIGAAGVWIVSKRRNKKIPIKLVANKDCTVYADNNEIAKIKDGNVTFVSLPKGQYYLKFEPMESGLESKNLAITTNKPNELFVVEFPEPKQEKKNVIKCFIAGSTKLEAERNALRSGIAQTHNNWRGKNFEILSYTYEDFEKQVVEGGHQSKYDEFIQNDATIAIFIISGEIGHYTQTEFDKAMNAFKNGTHPQILIFNDAHAPAHFQSEDLKRVVAAEKQYWTDYDSISNLRLQFMHTLDWLLIGMFYN